MPSGKRTSRGNRKVLMVFFKCPEEGTTKTRLAKELGPKEAVNVSRALLRYTFGIIERLRDVEIVLFYDSERKNTPPKGSVPEGWKLLHQVKGDMGQRFIAGFRAMFMKGAKKVVVIGTDCIGLSVKIITEAFDGLDGNDVTVGPAEDGGYYILGLKDPAPLRSLLTGISWGSDKVFFETINKAKGLKVHGLPRLFDVDMARDWERALLEDPRLRAILSSVEVDGGWP